MQLHFGFSYIGFLFLLMLMIPNIIWSRHQPKDYDKLEIIVLRLSIIKANAFCDSLRTMTNNMILFPCS